MDDTTFYQRQIRLKEVGEKGQAKLASSKVLVIGAGGLGAPLLEYITAAGVGSVSIYDHDKVEASNLHRQVLYGAQDIGKNKAVAAAQILSQKRPFLNIKAFPKKFDESVDVSSEDLVIDCTDNFQSKFIAHDKCFLEQTGFLTSSIHKFEGQAQLFDFSKEGEETACMRCLWRNQPSATCVETCAEAGVLGSVPGVLGTIQAMEALKFLLGLKTLGTQALMVNLLDMSFMKLTLDKDPGCPLCGEGDARELSNPDADFETTLENARNNGFMVVSLVPPPQGFEVDVVAPLENLPEALFDVEQEARVAVICARGFTSLKAVKALRASGRPNCVSVAGGYCALKGKSKKQNSRKVL